MPTPLPAATATAASNLDGVQLGDVFYPCSDGERMAEDMWQGEAMMNATFDLMAARPQALVAIDILVYPEEGNNKNRIGPDVLVALGQGQHNRWSYFVWVEGKPPDWVLEVAAPSMTTEVLDFKSSYYAKMGVPEFWLFDPKGDVLPRRMLRLQGFKLVDGEYQSLESRLVDGERTIRSGVLGLDVRIDGELLRFREVADRDIRHRAEVEADEKRAEARAEREAARASREAAARSAAEARASAAEARVAELEAALARSQDRSPP